MRALPQHLEVKSEALQSKRAYIIPPSVQALSAVAGMAKKTSYRNARRATDCLGPRRAPRQRRPARTIVTRSQSHVRGGLFRRLPSELFDMILDQMTGDRAAYCSTQDAR